MYMCIHKTFQNKYQTYTRLTYKNKTSLLQERASKKSKVEGFSISNEVWYHSKSDLMKSSFNVFIWELLSSKVIWSRSFQIHQNKQIKVKRQTVLLFLSSPINFHLKRIFLTEIENTQIKSKTDNRKIHSTLVLSQWFYLQLLSCGLIGFLQ